MSATTFQRRPFAQNDLDRLAEAIVERRLEDDWMYKTRRQPETQAERRRELTREILTALNAVYVVAS